MHKWLYLLAPLSRRFLRKHVLTAVVSLVSLVSVHFEITLNFQQSISFKATTWSVFGRLTLLASSSLTWKKIYLGDL